MKYEINEVGVKLSIEDIKKFETEHNLKFTELYTKFLLECNGGDVTPNVYKISDNNENIIGDLYSIESKYDYNDLHWHLDVFKDRIAHWFIPIGDNTDVSQICLGIKEPYYEKIYFWDHENEVGEEDNINEYMDNMYFLANNIYEFLDNLYEDEDEEQFFE